MILLNITEQIHQEDLERLYSQIVLLSFPIPFNRQQLANFLSVDRSAMSNELCKLRDEGMLDFYKNEFTLYEG